MAEELLRLKGDDEPIGINWPSKFLKRHPSIKSVYVPPLDKERAMAEDPKIIDHWFGLFSQLKEQYNIDHRDVYNMDEKGFLQGFIPKLKVMINKNEKKAYVTQPGNREWVSLIECISMDGRRLSPWVIFKAKQLQRAWYQVFKEGEITISDNGWTDNSIGLAWLQKCFHLETELTRKGEYRMLLVDGHASHITTQAIQFCIDKKIILLCLPAHLTHILQPLDVGIFSPLATAYKLGVLHNGELVANYHVDKVEFLEIYQRARRMAITPKNIESAWAKTGLLPFNPQLILSTLPPIEASEVQSQQLNFNISITVRPTTPPETIVDLVGPDGNQHRIDTPGNSLQVMHLLKQATDGKIAPKDVLTKVGKATIYAMAESHIHGTTNKKLVEQNRKKEKKANRTKGNFGYARYMNDAVLKEREDRIEQQKEAEKAKNKKDYEDSLKHYLNGINKFGPHIFTWKASRFSLSKRVSISSSASLLLTPKRMTQGPPSTPNHRTPKALKTCFKRHKMIITLYVRVSERELHQGLRARQIIEQRQQDQEGVRQGAEAEEERSHVRPSTGQMGRGMRTRKPSRR